MYPMKKMQQMLTNGKSGAVRTQIYEMHNSFDVETEEGILVDSVVTNEEIAHFCGITSASSVNWMVQQLKELGITGLRDHKALTKGLDMIRDNTTV